MDQKSREASEAQRLLSEPLLAEAFEAVRIEAMLALTEVDASNVTEVLRLQATANCVASVVEKLKAKIIASGVSDGGISIETNKRPE